MNSGNTSVKATMKFWDIVGKVYYSYTLLNCNDRTTMREVGKKVTELLLEQKSNILGNTVETCSIKCFYQSCDSLFNRERYFCSKKTNNCRLCEWGRLK